MDEFEGYAPGQGNRVAWTADKIAETLGVSARDRSILQQAAMVHDIGEVRMSRDYLRADRPLTMSERLDLERHPIIGEQEGARLELPKSVQLLIRWHHEWWNGNGYPDHLETDQIPLTARILRVADSYCSLTADRPWRRAKTDQDAREQLYLGAGHEFDPAVVYELRSINLPAVSKTATSDEGLELFSSFGR